MPPSLWCSSLRAVPFVSAPFSISLVLILIVLGAALYGWGLEALLSGTAQLPDIRLRIPDRVICGWTEESLLSGALYRLPP